MPRKKQPVSKKAFPSDSVERFENEVQSVLDTLTTQEKIRFLKERIINFEHDITDDIELTLAEIGDGYYKRCKRALKKYEQLAELEEEQSPPTTSRNPDFTTARQVLAVHYLLRAAEMRPDSVDKTDVARLIEFLTGKNYRNIYHCVRQPLKPSDKEAEKDLKFIKPYFEKLGLTQVIALIEKELKFTATE
ncbi:MAG: hypothetical protein ACREEM_11135 [Blastocatellia bacterium]